jgi:archaellum component FlaC
MECNEKIHEMMARTTASSNEEGRLKSSIIGKRRLLRKKISKIRK